CRRRVCPLVGKPPPADTSRRPPEPSLGTVEVVVDPALHRTFHHRQHEVVLRGSYRVHIDSCGSRTRAMTRAESSCCGTAFTTRAEQVAQSCPWIVRRASGAE